MNKTDNYLKCCSTYTSQLTLDFIVSSLPASLLKSQPDIRPWAEE
jgi:hypothetical protein